MIDFTKAKTTKEGYLVSSGEAGQGIKPTSMFSNYQLEEYEFAISKCKQFRRALDIGACYGIQSLRMLKHFDVVESFEPLFHEFLDYNTNGKTHIHPYALGNEEKTVSMRIGLYNSGGSNVVVNTDEKQVYQEVEMKTLDSFNFTDVDFIKMDVEGYEWLVMLGGMKTIKQCDVFMVEIGRKHQHKDLIEEYFESNGYHSKKFKNDIIFWRQ